MLLIYDREREEAMEDTKYDISENNEVIKDDAIIPRLDGDAVKPVLEEETNLDEKEKSEEEFDCSSVTVSSEGERKIAALDEKSRRLKAQFAEENRLAIESMDKIREEIKQSQKREDAITSDMDEMRHRQDEIKQDLRRLDEMSKRREREEEKWKAKIDKKKKNISRRLDKVRADRREYQQETEAENEKPENQDHSDVELKIEAGREMEQECKDASKTTISCLEEDTSNIILYEDHEVKEYSSVKQLEKKRKELRRLERMEKKAIKREKLEQRERKKIEKEKRKVARKLEKLRAKNSAVTEKNLASSQCVNDQAQGVSTALLQGNSEEPQTVNPTEHETTHVTATCDVDQTEHDASNEASDRDQTEGNSSSHAREVRPSVSNGVIVALGNSELDISDDMKMSVLDSIIYETEVVELAPEEVETMEQRSFKLRNDKSVGIERSVGEELEKKPYNEFVMENSKESSRSGDNQMDNEDASEDVEIDCVDNEDTLKDISVELFSVEEELDLIEPHNSPKCGGALEKNFKSEECACKMAQDKIPPLCFNSKETSAKSHAFDHTGGECRDNDNPLQCLDILTDVELSTRSKGNKCTGDSLEKSVPKPEYVKEDDNDVPDEFVNDGNDDDTIDMTLSDESFDHGNPGRTGSSIPIANEPSLLMRKVSGRLTPDGLQPLSYSPGNGELNLIFEDTVPSEEDVEGNVRDEDGQFPLEENSSLDHLETGSSPDETWSNDLGISFRDLPKEMQEALIQRYAAYTDVEGDENVQVDIIYEEVSRRSSDPNSFSIVCEETSVQTCDQESWMEQDIIEEIDDASIEETSLSEERSSAFLKCDEMKGKQESVDVLETEPEVELRESEGNVECDHELRDSIKERGVMEVSQLPFTASETLSVESSPMHSPDELDSRALGYNDSALPEELKSIPMNAASTSNSLETLTNDNFHKCSDRFSTQAYNPQPTAKHNFKDDDFIAEFDDFLGEVEESLEMAEKQGGAKTVETSKVVGAFAQSTFDSKTQEVLPDHGNKELKEKSRGLKEDTPSHQEIYEDDNIALAIADKDTSKTPVLESKVALHCSRSQQSGNGEDVVLDTPKELDSSALLNDTLQSDNSGDKDDYTSDRRASSFENNMLEKTDGQKMFLGSENTGVYSKGETHDFACSMEGPLADTKVQDEQNLDATNKKNQQLMEKNIQKEEKYIDEKSGYGIATETSRADSAVTRAEDESPVSEIQELLSKENTEVEKSHSICDTGHDLDSWGSIDDMLPSDSHCITDGKEESIFGASDMCDAVNEEGNQKNEEEDRKPLERQTSPVSVLESTMALRERRRDSLLSPGKDENISVVGERVKSTHDEACALEIQKDADGGLAPPSVNGVKKRTSSAHQEISVPDIDDEVLTVGEEWKRIEYHEQSVLHVTPAKDRNRPKDNKVAVSDGKATGGDVLMLVDSIMDKTFDASLEEKFSQVDIPSTNVSQRSHSTKRFFSGREKARGRKHNEDEFINDFDRLLDEAEEDIRIEESLSSSKSNPNSSESENAVAKIEDQSIIDVETLDESVTWVTDIGNVESLLSSCDEEVAAINDGILEVVSDYKEEPDSWNALDEFVDRRLQNRECSFALTDGENGMSDERRRAQYERTVAAVVNISEYLLHQELLAAVKARTCEVTERDALEDEVKASVTKDPEHKDDTNSPTEEKMKAYEPNKGKGITVSREKETVGDAIKKLNKLHSKVTDIREQLSGGNGPRGERFSVKTEIDSATVLLNCIRTLDDNIGEMAEEFKQANEKSNEASVKSDEQVAAEMLEESRKENAEMLLEITVKQGEVEAFQKKNESLHSELEATKAELKCLQSRDEYKQRELTNLKTDFEKKEEKWEEAEKSLENALTDKLELLGDVEYLEDSLRFSQENNQKLNTRVHDLNEIIKGLKKRAQLEDQRHDYGYLREEVELAKGSLELSNQRETLLRCQVDGLEAEVARLKHCEKTLKSNLNTVRYEKSRIIEQLEEKLTTAENENSKMIAELLRASDRENLLKELKDENLRVKNELEDQLNKLAKENSTLNAELSKISEKGNQMTELKSEATMVRKQLEDQLANLMNENHNLATELHKVSEKDSEMIQFKDETSKSIKQFEDQLATLRKENSTLTAELSKASEKDNQMNELKRETSTVINKLEDQLTTLRKENSTLTAELSKASEKDNQMRELKHETSTVINKLEDQLATLRKENSTLTAELSKASEKDNQIGELKRETSTVINKLEDQLTTLRKENSTLTAEMYKASEKDNQIGELKRETSKVINKLEDQLGTLKKENSTLVTELSKALEKDNQIGELKRETSKVIDKLEDQLGTLKKENSTLVTELSKALEKDSQMSELKRETSNVIKQLEDQLARLRKENSTLAREVSKVSEKDKQLTDLLNQLESLRTHNKLLQDQASEARKQLADELQCPQEETSEHGESSMRSRRSRRSKNSDIKMLRKRVRQNEQELEFLGRFIRQRGLEFGQRPRYHIDQDPNDKPDELPNVKETSNHEQEHERDKQNTSQVQEMEKVIEGITKSLRQTENDLHQAKDALTVKTERTEFLERRVEETEILLEETSNRLRQNQYNLEQTDATLRQQLERSATLEKQLQEMENARNSAITSNMKKDQEVEEVFRRICQKDQRIDDLIDELKQERFDKECLKRAIEVKESNALREKGLLERLRELEDELERTQELKETTLASLMDKQQELKRLYRSIDNRDARIDDLTLELKQERLDKDLLKRALGVTECNVNREKGLLEKSTQLERQLQEMKELREKTLASFKNNKEALEKRNTELEIQLQEMEKLQERTQSSLKKKDTELEQIYTSLSRKDDKIDELKHELKQERSEKRELRKVTERAGSNVQRQKILLDGRDEEVERLKEQLCDYEKKVEKLNVNLKQTRKELEVAEDMLTYRQNNVGNAGISSRLQYDHLEIFPTKQSRHTKESFREIGSLMVHVAERLSKLTQRQKEVDLSAALLKQKEAETKRAVERLREELNQRDDEIESLKSSLLKKATEAECMRGRIREVEYENVDLKKSLADEGDQVKKLEMLVKQLEGDVQRTQNSLKDKQTALEETKESLQLKMSLLTRMESKLYLRDNEIEELRVANKERGLELERVQTSLKEVKKELEISSSIITKQNEEFVHLRSSVNRKTWEADKVKIRVEPTQGEAGLLSFQLECAKKDNENLSRELAAATGRLENEQVLADRQKKALQEQVKSGLEDLKAKSKLIWDMKMSLQESTARISRLEAEKLEEKQEECFRDYKRKRLREVGRPKQSLNAANENESLLQRGIGSAGREMSELRKENQKLKFELALKETGELPQDGIKDASSGLFKVRLVTCSFGVHI